MTFGPNRDTDPDGVADLVLKKLTKEPKRCASFTRRKRKLPLGGKVNNERKRSSRENQSQNCKDPPPTRARTTPEIENFLKEVASSWKFAMRHHDRDTAKLLLQLSLKSIPKKSGTIYVTHHASVTHAPTSHHSVTHTPTSHHSVTHAPTTTRV